jgi:hypothetical protein
MAEFDRRLRAVPDQIWRDIARIDEVKGKWAHNAGLSPQVVNRLRRSVLVTSTGASTRIEGAPVSDEDVERVMRGVSM